MMVETDINGQGFTTLEDYVFYSYSPPFSQPSNSTQYNALSAEDLARGAGPTNSQLLRSIKERGLWSLATELWCECSKCKASSEGSTSDETNSSSLLDNLQTLLSHSAHMDPRPLHRMDSGQDQESKDAGTSVDCHSATTIVSGPERVHAPSTMTVNWDVASKDVPYSVRCEAAFSSDGLLDPSLATDNGDGGSKHEALLKNRVWNLVRRALIACIQRLKARIQRVITPLVRPT